MHLETLKTFVDLVDTRSFHKAAQRNLVSQSAVSQQLKALEARYDCRLVDRSRRGDLTLTEAGKLLYAECRSMLERFGALETRLRARSTSIGGTIRVATVYSIGLHRLPPYVSRFLKAHPNVNVHIEYSRTDKVCAGCLDGTLDFGIVAFPLRRSNLAVLPWHEEALVVVCPPQHRLAARRRIPASLLRGERFIAFERDIPTRKTIDAYLRSHGVRVNTVMEFDNIETIKRSVEVGSGVAVLPETTVLNEVKSGSLCQAVFAGQPCTRKVGIIHRRGRALSAAAQELIRVLTD
jgi:LysR family transcriptional regulator, transcriptional activator of the cysJI operon